MPRELIERTAHGSGPALENMGVDHRRFHALMAEKLLYRAEIVPVFQQVRSEGVSQSMTTHHIHAAAQGLGCRALHCVPARLAHERHCLGGGVGTVRGLRFVKP